MVDEPEKPAEDFSTEIVWQLYIISDYIDAVLPVSGKASLMFNTVQYHSNREE